MRPRGGGGGESVLAPLLDDLNTPAAMAELHKLTAPEALRAAGTILGFLRQTRSEREDFARRRLRHRCCCGRGADRGPQEARAAKDWAASDRARDALAAMGVAVKDNKDGTTTWTVAG